MSIDNKDLDKFIFGEYKEEKIYSPPVVVPDEQGTGIKLIIDSAVYEGADSVTS